MKSLDANIVLRFILCDIPTQTTKIMDLIDSSPSGSLVVPDLVFGEVVWVLGGPFYHLDRQLISNLLLELLTVPEIHANRSILFETINLYRKHTAISFIDAYLVVLAGENQALPLLTFDKKLAKSIPNMVQLL